MKRGSFLGRLLLGMLGLLTTGLCTQVAQGALQSIAFHYGANAPLDELHAFDVAVVDPDHGFDPQVYRSSSSELFAYVSVGEVHPSRAYAKQILPEWKLGKNTAWGSIVLDQRKEGWRAFFLEQVIAPLWSKGYRGFFLDTLDSYVLGGASADPTAQQAGLASLIRDMRQRFPGIRLITNRGFELMPQIAGELEAVAAESLFRGWDAGRKAYREVPPQDREWLLAKLNEVKARYGLPVISIDYVAPTDRVLMRQTAEKIRALGFIPWVADGGLSTLGISSTEVIPRRILIVHDSREAPGLHYRIAHRYLEMPLNYLGYVADYVDANEELTTPDPGLYAGVVAWFGGQLLPAPGKRYARWLRQRAGEGWRLALLGNPGFALDKETLSALTLVQVLAPKGRILVTQKTEGVGFETPPMPQRGTMIPLHLATGVGESWLRLKDDAGQIYDGVGIAPWGGFAWRPFDVEDFNEDVQLWVLNPWLFLQKALALPVLPVPDTTSDAGRRMAFAHMDGDAFPSRAEFSGRPYAGQAVLDEILRRYPTMMHTMSIIEGELSPAGLYPQDSAALEVVARQMFAMPNVEIASHTYSHPFRWKKVEAGDPSEEVDADYHLNLGGYVPSLQREINGSVDYIAKNLAPSGKPVKILLWSGDAAPSARAVEATVQAGLLNMNGGNTVITRANSSITQISPLGARLGKYFQVFAPIANENVYTNLWRGPFYGFRNVIETFELTGEPRRIKPIDIYFHSYAATKLASLNALRAAYDWTLSQPVRQVFASEFMRIAEAFNHVVLARDPNNDSILVRNAGALRSFRAPFTLGEPDLSADNGVAGWGDGPDGRYLVITGPDARLRFGKADQGVRNQKVQNVRFAGSNGKVLSWTRNEAGARGELQAHVPLEFDLADAQNCAVSANRRPLKGLPVGKLLRFKLTDVAATLDISCRGR